jgi:DNA-binding transcriptional LysR family regulator
MAMVGEYVVEADIKAGRLVRVLDGYTLPERVLHVLYQKDRYQPLRARLFIDYLSERIRDRQAVANP